jgi:hypothetical protein
MLLRVEVAAFHSGLNRLVSVALVVVSRRLGVTQHPALRSPDFPLAVSHASDCLADFTDNFSAIGATGLDFGNPAAYEVSDSLASKEIGMRRRLYFLLPDLRSATQTANDLLLARVEDRYMHFLAKRGTPLGGLHEASFLQKSDAVHGAQLGLVIGGLVGFLIGVYIYLTPPDGVALELVTALVSTVIGAILGAWMASLVASSVPNSRLRSFQSELDAGKILLMLDAPPSRIEELKSLVNTRHPEAARGIEATSPAFP